VCLIGLTSALDVHSADQLRRRLRELGERGCERLIIDMSSVAEPVGKASAVLADVFEAQAPTCEVVVVLARGSTLDWELPARVAIAWTLSDARRLLAASGESDGARERSGPSAVMSAGDRRALAIRQALRWAEQAAGAGDYEGALTALATIERVEGPLSHHWQACRQTWLTASAEATTRRDA